MSTTWLVTGANRGIGLALVKLLATDATNLIIAACRAPEKADELNALGKSVHVVKMDVSDAVSITASVEPVRAIVGELGIDYLINNAGMAHVDESPFNIDPVAAAHVLQVNVIGPALVAQAYLPLVETPGRRGVIMHISSSMGAFNMGPIDARLPFYCMSKSALNMLAAKQAAEKPNLIIFSACPGWVKTGLGGPYAQITPEESTTALVKLAKSATKEFAGKFYQRDGTSLGY